MPNPIYDFFAQPRRKLRPNEANVAQQIQGMTPAQRIRSAGQELSPFGQAGMDLLGDAAGFATDPLGEGEAALQYRLGLQPNREDVLAYQQGLREQGVSIGAVPPVTFGGGKLPRPTFGTMASDPLAIRPSMPGGARPIRAANPRPPAASRGGLGTNSMYADDTSMEALEALTRSSDRPVSPALARSRANSDAQHKIRQMMDALGESRRLNPTGHATGSDYDRSIELRDRAMQIGTELGVNPYNSKTWQKFFD